MAAAPTIVLVHGAFTDSSSWSSTLAALDGAGVPVLAVSNPLRDLHSDAAYVRSALDAIEGRVVLVGHSYGGAVIGEAARGSHRVAALVFIAAYVLDEGESVVSVLDPVRFGSGLLGPGTTVVRPCASTATADGVDTDVYVDLDAYREVLAADVPRDRARVMALGQRPVARSAMTGAAGPRPAWHDVPSWALVPERDNAIPPAGQHWMATRAGATVGTVAASHAAMVSQPAAVTQTILEAARFSDG